MSFLPLMLMAAVSFCFIKTPAVDPNRLISQYEREKWGPEKGFTGGRVYALAQTPDGCLWVGADNGLFRFDGFSFELVQQTSTPAMTRGPVLGLLTDRDGNLWVRLRGSGLFLYRDGRFSAVKDKNQQLVINVMSMLRTSDGRVLVSTLQGALLISGTDEFMTLIFPAKLPNTLINSIAQTGNEFWLGSRDNGLFQLSDGKFSTITENLPDVKVNALLSDGESSLWIGTDKGLVRWDGTKITNDGVPESLGKSQIVSMLKDSDQNLWLLTNRPGLVRLNADGILSMERDDKINSETDSVSTIFEDREGNLWTGGAQGIERYRDSAFVTYSTADNLPNDKNGALFVDSSNRTWIAPLAGGLYWFSGGIVASGKVVSGKVESVRAAGLADDIIYSIHGDGKNDLWLGRQRGGLTNLHFDGQYLTAKTFTAADGLAQNSIYSVYQSRSGSIWAGTLSGGVSLYQNGKFTTFSATNGLASNTVTAIAESFDGTMWFATPAGLSRLAAGKWLTFTNREGLPSENITSLYIDPAGIIWVGTDKGLAFVDQSGAAHSVADGTKFLSESILGITGDKNGSLWLSTTSHVLQMTRSNLLAGSLSDADVHIYSVADGLKSSEGVKRSRSVMTDYAGRIWFSLSRGISMADTEHLKKSSPPAIVRIKTVSADGNVIDSEDPLQLPSTYRRFAFDYIGVSLSMPEHIKYRFYLEGFDKGWSEPTALREAVYTNLNSGDYTFHVIAANSEGIWNSSEAVFSFRIKPPFWQTWWFEIFCMTVAAFIIIGLYRLRVRTVTQALKTRFEERLAERTRIAQELHDSLLQGVVSASMQLNVAVDSLPDDLPVKPQLDHIIDLMNQVTTEGRNTLRGLRSSTVNNSDYIEKAFAEIRPETGHRQPVNFRVVVEGNPQVLQAGVRDEVYAIGREALINAYHHADAENIEFLIEYAGKYLRIEVCDDGCGIDPQILQKGREGHWGLTGMRERAARIGGRLKIRSKSGAGTEIELMVPGRIAFPEPSSNKLLEKLIFYSFRKYWNHIRKGNND